MLLDVHRVTFLKTNSNFEGCGKITLCQQYLKAVFGYLGFLYSSSVSVTLTLSQRLPIENYVPT